MPPMTALWLCRFAQTSAAVLLAGTTALRLLAHGTGLDPAWRSWRKLAWTCGVALLAASALQLGLTAAEMSGEPLARAWTRGLLGEVLGGTRFGVAWRVRMGLLGAWFAVTGANAEWRRSGREPLVPWVAGEALLAAALLGSLILAGHAQASEKSAWLLPVDVSHAIAAGVWPGGLWPLASLFARARRDPVLVPVAVVISRRFSRLSVAAVGVLALSGLLNGLGLVGTPAALGSSAYGRLVLCKAVLFVLMVGLGAINRRLLQREENPADAARTVRRLWGNVAVEGALAVGVLLATEALAMNAPPASL